MPYRNVTKREVTKEEQWIDLTESEPEPMSYDEALYHICEYIPNEDTDLLNRIMDDRYHSATNLLDDISRPSDYERIKADLWNTYQDDYLESKGIEIGEDDDPDDYEWDDDEFYEYINDTYFHGTAAGMFWYLWTEIDSYEGDEILNNVIEEENYLYDDEVLKLCHMKYLGEVEHVEEWEEQEYYEEEWDEYDDAGQIWNKKPRKGKRSKCSGKKCSKNIKTKGWLPSILKRKG